MDIMIFLGCEALLLLGPLFGFLLRLHLRAAPSSRPRVYWVLASLLLAGAAISFSPLSFTGVALDAAIIAAAYAAYCGVAFAALSIRFVGKVVFAVMAVPMAVGIFTATVGVLGVKFIVNDFFPRREVWVSSRYSCRYNSFGNVTTGPWGGTDVSVLYHPPFTPGLEWRKFSRSFDDSTFNDEQISCSLDSAGGGQLIITAPTLKGRPERISLPLR